jgi:hypothetical protein
VDPIAPLSTTAEWLRTRRTAGNSTAGLFVVSELGSHRDGTELMNKRRGFVAAAALLSTFTFSGAGARAESLALQVKSFISPVDWNDPKQWDDDAKACQQAAALAVWCGTGMWDQPVDGQRSSKNFRLWSQVDIDVSCAGSKIANWTIKALQQDFGTELAFLTTSGSAIRQLTATPALKGTSATDKVTLSYKLGGQPNALAIIAMNQFKSRTCSTIWHDVQATLTCSAGTPALVVSLKGSGFPSHTAWVGNKLVKTIPQGPFKNLWRCDPKDPSEVQ